MIPALSGSRPQSLPANIGHQTYLQGGHPNQGNITAGVTGATGGTPISNPTQIGNSNWGPSQNRGAFISSLPPPSQLLNSASYSGTNRNVSQQLELKADGSSSQSAQDHHFAPRPRDL